MSNVYMLHRDLTLFHGDMRDVLRVLPDNFVDAVVTDPPYHLTNVVQRFGADDAAPARSNGPTGVYARSSAGFMGKRWDGGDISFQPDTWREIFRVLKPGGHLLAMGGTRTYHRLACAIEDAGFEIRDMVAFMYGTGFPKSLDVSKQIDKAAGAEREVTGQDCNFGKSRIEDGKIAFGDYAGTWDITAPATDAARKWQGWGTALKPAIEPTCLARKPLSEATVAANVLRWGTGALNIDGCRVSSGEERKTLSGGMGRKANPIYGQFVRADVESLTTTQGRWPANVIHDGSAEVIEAFPVTTSGKESGPRGTRPGGFGNVGASKGSDRPNGPQYGDFGSAARFFYSAKASKAERAGSKHPTVKPIALKAHFIRLITPPGGIVLDPFAGTGTTGAAALQEGKRCLLIEREDEYAADIQRRFTVDNP